MEMFVGWLRSNTHTNIARKVERIFFYLCIRPPGAVQRDVDRSDDTEPSFDGARASTDRPPGTVT